MVQICPANAERIADVLIWTRSVSVERDGEALNANSCHLHSSVWTPNVHGEPRAPLLSASDSAVPLGRIDDAANNSRTSLTTWSPFGSSIELPQESAV